MSAAYRVEPAGADQGAVRRAILWAVAAAEEVQAARGSKKYLPSTSSRPCGTEARNHPVLIRSRPVQRPLQSVGVLDSAVVHEQLDRAPRHGVT